MQEAIIVEKKTGKLVSFDKLLEFGNNIVRTSRTHCFAKYEIFTGFTE